MEKRSYGICQNPLDRSIRIFCNRFLCDFLPEMFEAKNTKSGLRQLCTDGPITTAKAKDVYFRYPKEY
jgi:hypothetical protein